MSNNQRKRVVVDQQLQSQLARRIVTYWCLTWLLVFTLPILVRMFSENVPFQQLATQIIADFWFPIVMSVFMIPIVVWDSIRFSNRVAGPIYRITKTIRELAGQAPVRTLKIRQNDFCHDVVDAVNVLVDQHQQRNADDSQFNSSDSLETVAS